MRQGERVARFDGSQDLSGAEFEGVSLRGARFRACDLSGSVMRAMDVDGAEIDAPWLLEGGSLIVNGVDVAPYVDAELDRRFLGRGLRRADTPATLAVAWAALEAAWSDAVARAEAMPPGTVDVSVAGEWSFAQTLRHLVMATDTWLGRAILGREKPFHPAGLPDDSGSAAYDEGDFTAEPPTFAEVLEARADRQAMVRDHIASLTSADLGEERRNPHDTAYPETVLTCLRTILEEEWEHHRYAVRDLDALAAR